LGVGFQPRTRVVVTGYPEQLWVQGMRFLNGLIQLECEIVHTFMLHEGRIDTFTYLFTSFMLLRHSISLYVLTRATVTGGIIILNGNWCRIADLWPVSLANIRPSAELP
jgi:hypothetical protein